jgi:hypothetical protein
MSEAHPRAELLKIEPSAARLLEALEEGGVVLYPAALTGGER